MRTPQNSFEPYTNTKNSTLGPQKVKKDPEIKSKSNVRIDLKTVVEPYSNTKNSPLGPQKLSQIQRLELKETYKIKVVQLYE